MHTNVQAAAPCYRPRAECKALCPVPARLHKYCAGFSIQLIRLLRGAEQERLHMPCMACMEPHRVRLMTVLGDAGRTGQGSACRCQCMQLAHVFCISGRCRLLQRGGPGSRCMLRRCVAVCCIAEHDWLLPHCRARCADPWQSSLAFVDGGNPCHTACMSTQEHAHAGPA
jgi:hypothetical protein